MEFVTVGNPGNVGKLAGLGAGGAGINATVGNVSDNYQIGKYEVTAAQYCEFLNAQAKTDCIASARTTAATVERLAAPREPSIPWPVRTNGPKPHSIFATYAALLRLRGGFLTQAVVSCLRSGFRGKCNAVQTDGEFIHGFQPKQAQLAEKWTSPRTLQFSRAVDSLVGRGIMSNRHGERR